jgi:DNA/RNA-binding domain of Phe-tRNA-synthetase-like protein
VSLADVTLFTVADSWLATFPGTSAGVLAMRNVSNPERHASLEQRKEDLQAQLRARYAGATREALGALPAIKAYSTYYKKFKKTYHVALQLESVVLKGKPIPTVNALVEAMFMAELDSLLLTAGHDLDTIDSTVTLGASEGSEKYTLLRGDEQQLKPGDMFMADTLGVISSVIYGPDLRTQITPATRSVLYTVYAPAGVGAEAVRGHLSAIESNVRCVSPDATLILSEVYTAQ